jgi:hypothetical protein
LDLWIYDERSVIHLDLWIFDERSTIHLDLWIFNEILCYLILAPAMKLMMDSVANTERMHGKTTDSTSEDRNSQGV